MSNHIMKAHSMRARTMNVLSSVASSANSMVSGACWVLKICLLNKQDQF